MCSVAANHGLSRAMIIANGYHVSVLLESRPAWKSSGDTCNLNFDRALLTAAVIEAIHEIYTHCRWIKVNSLFPTTIKLLGCCQIVINVFISRRVLKMRGQTIPAHKKTADCSRPGCPEEGQSVNEKTPLTR